jgi:hypothetical protein
MAGTLSSSPIITANWLAASSNRWTMPIGGGGGKIVEFGKLPVNFQLQAFCNVVRPQQGRSRLATAIPSAVSFPEIN